MKLKNIFLRGSLFNRGHFRHEELAHFNENDNYSSGQFSTRIMTDGHYCTSKKDFRSLFYGCNFSTLPDKSSG